jgi:hypothetical protein
MDVQIESLTSNIEVADSASALSPEVMRKIIAAVKAELARDAEKKKAQKQDLDARSIVRQQRGGTH